MIILKSIVVVVFFIGVHSYAGSCPPDEYWVSAHPRSTYQKSDGTTVSATNVVGHCRSKSKAYQYWSNEIVSGKIDGWPHKKEKMKEWSREDIENVIRSFDKIPDGLWEKTKIYRADKSQTRGNTATSSDGIVVLYDNAFENLSLLPRYLVHELAHQKFNKLSDLSKLAYQQIAGWTRTSAENAQPKFVLKRPSVVTADSDLGPEEDFANNLEYFLYEPAKLKAKNPAIYDWFWIEYGDKIRKGGSQ